MKIFFVRHGEAKEDGGKSPLTERGVLEAKAVAKELQKYSFSKVYSSNSERAKNTAKEYLNLNKGIEYLETEKLKEIYRVLIGGPEKEGTSKERAEENKKRADEIWGFFLKEKNNILVFSHGNIIRYFLNKVLKKDEDLWKNLQIDSGSISILEITGKNVKINKINLINHLPKEELKGSIEKIYIE